MKILLLFFAVFMVDKTIAQSMYILNDRDSIEFFYTHEEDTLIQVNYGFYKPRFRRERQRLMYRNGTVLDSAGNRFRSKPTIKGLTLVGYGYKDGVTQVIKWPIEGNLNIQTDDRLVSYASNYPVALKKKGEYLPTEVISIQNDSIETIIDFEQYLGYENPPGIPEEILSILSINGQTILETAYCDGGCYSYRYFIVQNKMAKELSFSNIKTDVQTRTGEEEENFRVNFYFSHNDYDFLMARVDYGNLPEQTDLIFSKDLEDTTHIIKKHQPFEIIGENIQEGKNQFFYLRSRLDNGEKVIVSYKVDKAFEKVAYQIFRDRSITKDQIKPFNAEQLGILKNLIFAKHNYDFNADFYQAYFNLFHFYNEEKKRASRTKDMNGLLTEADIKNLEVINKALKKYD